MSDHPAVSSNDAGEGADSGAGQAWRFHIVVEIANFAELRRLVGRSRATMLAHEIAGDLAYLVPSAVPDVMGQDRIDLEFAAGDRGALDIAMDRIDTSLTKPIMVDKVHHLIELHIGAAATAVRDVDATRLCEEAEAALARSRLERRPIALNVAAAVLSIDRIALSRDLAAAISSGDLFLHYQPKVHLRRHQVTGAEALVRWRHPTRGLIMPGDFIPLAEENRDIVELTLWTVRSVIADQAVLQAHGHSLPLFVNIAGVLLADEQFVRRVGALVQASSAKIGFEITETSVIRDPASAIANLKIFADMGIVIAIDDYGAGLSSLAYLKQLPASELKIDKMFVTQLTSSHRDPLIVRSTIDLAHALEMEVVAEGVETAAALALLSVMGCDMAQGYLVSRPVDRDGLIRFLDEGSSMRTLHESRGTVEKLANGWRGR